MLPVGPMMREHRLIEKMIQLMQNKLSAFEKNQEVDSEFVDLAVDFIRTYADRCHHGKEENILFRELAKKPLSQEHKKIMGELIEEHKQGRHITGALNAAKDKYARGDKGAIVDIIEQMKILVKYYPRHIDKEDRHFFKPVMDYFSDQEKESMLREGFEFDQHLIHEKYEHIVDRLSP